jgi:hypothetical protein
VRHQSASAWRGIVSERVSIHIVPAVLRSEQDGSLIEETLDTRAPRRLDSFDFGRGRNMGGAIHGVRGEDLHSRIEQRAMRERKQQLIDWSIDPARPIIGGGAARQNRNQCPFSFQRAFAVPMLVASILEAIAESERVNPLDPALQNGRRPEPPKRKLQDDGIDAL